MIRSEQYASPSERHEMQSDARSRLAHRSLRLLRLHNKPVCASP